MIWQAALLLFALTRGLVRAFAPPLLPSKKPGVLKAARRARTCQGTATPAPRSETGATATGEPAPLPKVLALGAPWRRWLLTYGPLCNVTCGRCQRGPPVSFQRLWADRRPSRASLTRPLRPPAVRLQFDPLALSPWMGKVGWAGAPGSARRSSPVTASPSPTPPASSSWPGSWRWSWTSAIPSTARGHDFMSSSKACLLTCSSDNRSVSLWTCCT